MAYVGICTSVHDLVSVCSKNVQKLKVPFVSYPIFSQFGKFAKSYLLASSALSQNICQTEKVNAKMSLFQDT